MSRFLPPWVVFLCGILCVVVSTDAAWAERKVALFAHLFGGHRQVLRARHVAQAQGAFGEPEKSLRVE